MRLKIKRFLVGIIYCALGLCIFLPAAASAAGAPIARWKFDDGSGTAPVDSGPYTITGSFMTPNPTWSTDVPPVSYDNPYSLSFTNTGDGVQFSWPSALNFNGTDERSFSFWYKPTANGETASGNYDRIMSWSGDAFEIAGTYGNVAVHRLAFYDGSWRDTNYNLTVGTWYNITFTYDGTNVKLFVSGVEKFSGTSGGRDLSGTMYIGVRHTGDEGINGRIDDVRMYDYALSPSQIDNIVQGSENADSAPAPTLSGALLPADNATDIDVDSNLVMTFNRVVQGGTGSIIIKKSSDNSIVETIPAQDGRVTGSGTRIITINPSTRLVGTTSYYVQVEPSAIRSGSGTFFAGFSGTGSWNFTTTASSESTDAGGGGVSSWVLQLRRQNGLNANGTVAAGSSSSASSVTSSLTSSESLLPAASESSSASNASLTSSAQSMTSSAPAEHEQIVAQDSVVFLDVWEDDWFGFYVKTLLDLQIFEGYKDTKGKPLGKYGPADSITMGQLAKVGDLLSGQTVTPVIGNEWEEPYITAAKAARLSVFLSAIDPKAPARRGMVIQTILEALGIPMTGTVTSMYSDVPANSPYAAAIATATELGIVSGDAGRTTFRPNAPINRAEVAKMVVLALGR